MGEKIKDDDLPIEEETVGSTPEQPATEEDEDAGIIKEIDKRIGVIQTSINDTRRRFAEAGVTPEQFDASTVGRVFGIVSGWLRVRELVSQECDHDNDRIRKELAGLRVTMNNWGEPDRDSALRFNVNEQFEVDFRPAEGEIRLAGPYNGGDDHLMYSSEKYPNGGGTSDTFGIDGLDPEMTDDQSGQLKEMLGLVDDYLDRVTKHFEASKDVRGFITRDAEKPAFPTRELAEARGEDKDSTHYNLPYVLPRAQK